MEKREDLIIFNDFPLAPSTNQLYKQVGYKRVPSQKYSQFKGQCYTWTLKNRKILSEASKLLLSFIDKKMWIQIHYLACVKHSKIWTKKNKVKRNDPSNRIKATEDQLANALGIDDRHFCVGSAQWIVSKGPEKMILLLNPAPILDDDFINDQRSDQWRKFMSQYS